MELSDKISSNSLLEKNERLRIFLENTNNPGGIDELRSQINKIYGEKKISYEEVIATARAPKYSHKN